MADQRKLYFTSDYMEGAHPQVLSALTRTNMEHTSGYGTDAYCDAAKDKIRDAIQAPDAEIYFLAGGTQANAVVIGTALRPYQGVISASSGHVSVHEAGAIEFGGHKVLALPHKDGKITADSILNCIREYESDENRDHMVMPGMVYLSQPTEYGTLYSLQELEQISWVCHTHGIILYMDGARLAYALACKENDVTLPDIAKLCDAFYIGGTKCGTLFGEAVVFPGAFRIPHFFTMVKQHGALLAKGRIAGIQFETLFTDNLYMEIGRHSLELSDMIRSALKEKGYEFAYPSPTNQIFVILNKEQREALEDKVAMGFMENLDQNRAVMRICTSWATGIEDVEELIALL